MNEPKQDTNTTQLQGHYKRHMEKEYMGSHDLMRPDASYAEAVVTIKGAYKRAVFNSAKGKEERCTVLAFEDKEKLMIANVTNQDSIAAIAGTPQIHQWNGVQVTVYVKKGVKVRGKLVDALRIKPVKGSK